MAGLPIRRPAKPNLEAAQPGTRGQWRRWNTGGPTQALVGEHRLGLNKEGRARPQQLAVCQFVGTVPEHREHHRAPPRKRPWGAPWRTWPPRLRVRCFPAAARAVGGGIQRHGTLHARLAGRVRGRLLFNKVCLSAFGARRTPTECVRPS